MGPGAGVFVALIDENYAELDVAPSATLAVPTTVGQIAASFAAHNAAAALPVPVASVLVQYVVPFEAILALNVHIAAARLEGFVQAAAEPFVHLEDPETVLAAEKDPETVLAAEITDSCIVVDTVKHQQFVHAARWAEKQYPHVEHQTALVQSHQLAFHTA